MKGCMIEHTVLSIDIYMVESSKQSETRLSRTLGAQSVFSFGGAGSKDNRIHLDAENISF